MTTLKKKRYTTEFKRSAAKLVLVEGYTQKQAADRLGVSLSAIARWVIAEREQQEEHPEFSATQQSEAQLEQIKQLQLENEQLR